jgi:hypothetical protein
VKTLQTLDQPKVKKAITEALDQLESALAAQTYGMSNVNLMAMANWESISLTCDALYATVLQSHQCQTLEGITDGF